ncbi:MAG: dihydrodipicolinate synthase family protein, partial [Clostridia bacterium]
HNVDNLLALGTTSESVLLSENEKHNICSFVYRHKGNAKLLVGVGSCSTSKTLKDCLWAYQNGADGLLVVTPYYLKGSIGGIKEHFASCVQSVDVPIVAYNVPHRTGYDAKISEITEWANTGVVAIKETSTDLEKVTCEGQINGLTLLCGSDSLLAPYLSVNARGIVSVVSNAFPAITKKTFHSCNPTDNYLHAKIAELCFIEASPMPTKYILMRKKLIRSCECRLPLTTISKDSTTKIDALLEKYGKEVIL